MLKWFGCWFVVFSVPAQIKNLVIRGQSYEEYSSANSYKKLWKKHVDGNLVDAQILDLLLFCGGQASFESAGIMDPSPEWMTSYPNVNGGGGKYRIPFGKRTLKIFAADAAGASNSM